MDERVWLDGSIVEGRSARVPITLAGVIYGWGVFTTLRVYDGKPFALDYHWERLIAHAEAMRLKLPLDLETITAAVNSLLAANARRNGRVRITVLKEETGAWQLGEAGESHVLIFSADETQARTREVAITMSPYRLLSTRLLAGVKQTSMLENLLAFEEARSRSFDEAIMLNERGEIVGATAANIFWVEGDEVFTPSLATGCVPGVTRRVVHELAEKWKLHVVEGGFTVKRLLDAREVFLTSTQREIAIVRTFDAKEYQVRQARISNLLARKLKETITGMN